MTHNEKKWHHYKNIVLLFGWWRVHTLYIGVRKYICLNLSFTSVQSRSTENGQRRAHFACTSRLLGMSMSIIIIGATLFDARLQPKPLPFSQHESRNANRAATATTHAYHCSWFIVSRTHIVLNALAYDTNMLAAIVNRIMCIVQIIVFYCVPFVFDKYNMRVRAAYKSGKISAFCNWMAQQYSAEEQ